MKVQMESFKKAEEQANKHLTSRNARVVEENKERMEKHAKIFEKLVESQTQDRLERSQSLRMKYKSMDDWKAQKQHQYEERLKKVKKAEELRLMMG